MCGVSVRLSNTMCDIGFEVRLRLHMTLNDSLSGYLHSVTPNCEGAQTHTHKQHQHVAASAKCDTRRVSVNVWANKKIPLNACWHTHTSSVDIVEINSSTTPAPPYAEAYAHLHGTKLLTSAHFCWAVCKW